MASRNPIQKERGTLKKDTSFVTQGKFLHCVRTGILTQVIRLMVYYFLGIHFRKMNNPKIFDYLWKHFSFIGNQGHRINVLPPKGSLGASICRHPKLRTACALRTWHSLKTPLQAAHQRCVDREMEIPH